MQPRRLCSLLVVGLFCATAIAEAQPASRFVLGNRVAGEAAQRRGGARTGWPTPRQYDSAIKKGAQSFHDPRLAHARFPTDPHSSGDLLVYSGQFASVYPAILSSGDKIAVRLLH